MNEWNVTEVDGVLEEGDESTLLVFDRNAGRHKGLNSAEELLNEKNYIDLSLRGTDEDPEERFSDDEIRVRGDGFYVVDPERDYSVQKDVPNDGQDVTDTVDTNGGQDSSSLGPIEEENTEDVVSQGSVPFTRYEDRDFWADVKRGMEDLDDNLDDLAGYIQDGEFNLAIETMERAVEEVGGYDQTRKAAEAMTEYLGDVEGDISELYGELDGLRLELKEATQDLQQSGFRQDELDSMDGIQKYASNR